MSWSRLLPSSRMILNCFWQTKNRFEEVIKTLTDIEANTGLRVNYEKSSIHTVAEAKRFDCEHNFIWDPGGITVLGIDVFQSSEQFDKLLDKAKSVLTLWTKRKLTLMGKILVINTLIASLFVYVMNVSTDPNEEFFVNFDKLLYNYIWNGKRAKIPMDLLKLTKESGGLNLTNLRLKCKALKIAWLFTPNDFCQAQINAVAPEGLDSRFWECMMEKRDVVKFLINKDINPFWSEVIHHWFEFTWSMNATENKQNINQYTIIWFNSDVKSDGEVLYYAKAAKSGFTMLGDLLNDELNPCTFKEINERFPDSMTWWQYTVLISAIPKKWIKILKQVSRESAPEYWYEKLENIKKVPAYVYKLISETRSDTYILKYRQLNKKCGITEDEFHRAFKNLYSVTNVTKLRDFQYRLLVNAIHTNTRLIHWKIVESAICEFCLEEKQTVTHLMYECKIIKNEVWIKLEKFILRKKIANTSEIQVNLQNVMLNTVHENARHLINLFTLIAKQHIFACKCLNREIRFEEIIEKIEILYQIESYNASNGNNGKKHEKKWAPYTNTSPTASQRNITNDYVVEYVSRM